MGEPIETNKHTHEKLYTVLDPYTCLDQDSETIISKRVGKQKSLDFFGFKRRKNDETGT